jgi:hypothetical protein
MTHRIAGIDDHKKTIAVEWRTEGQKRKQLKGASSEQLPINSTSWPNC